MDHILALLRQDHWWCWCKYDRSGVSSVDIVVVNSIYTDVATSTAACNSYTFLHFLVVVGKWCLVG